MRNYEIGDVVFCIDGMRKSEDFPTLRVGKALDCGHRCHIGDRYRIERIRENGVFRIRNMSSNLSNTGCYKCLIPDEEFDELSIMEW